MFQRLTGHRDQHAKLAALNRSLATIEFALDGTIPDANANFLAEMGYTPEEIRGRHHGLFIEPTHRDSETYRQFWDALRRGKFQSDQYKRAAKDGRAPWIQAAYNPITDADGRPIRVVKFVTDITAQVHER